MTADHAADRRRVFLALHDNPGGIVCTDLEREPTIDGLPPMTRVAARVHELREEHVIPEGLRRGAFALYRLTRAGEGTVTPLRAREAPHTGRDGPDGLVALCHGCLTNHTPPFLCPHGHRVELMSIYNGPTNQRCRAHQREAA